MPNKENSEIDTRHRVLLINPYFDPYFRSSKAEPRGLLSIYNNIIGVCRSLIVDINVVRLNPISIIKYIIQNRIDVVGLSLFFYKEHINNNWAFIFVKLLRKFCKDVTLVLGGYGPTFYTEYFIEKYQPDFIVVGPGEKAMRTLIENKFKISSNPDENGGLIITTKSNIGRGSHTTIVEDIGILDIDSFDYSRPKEFFLQYDNFVVDTTRGCVGNCIFCDPSTLRGERKIVNRDNQKSKEELDYLLKNTSKESIFKFAASGNTFNNPNDVIELIKYLEEKGVVGRSFSFTLRLDKIDFIIKNSDIIGKFLYLNDVSFEIGLETFDTEILLKLRKIGENNKDCDYFDKISKLASIFPETEIFLDIIPFTPWITIESLLKDYEKYAILFDRYHNIILRSYMILNRLRISRDTGTNVSIDWKFEDPIVDIFSECIRNQKYSGMVLGIFKILNEGTYGMKYIDEIDTGLILDVFIYIIKLLKDVVKFTKYEMPKEDKDEFIIGFLEYVLYEVSKMPKK